MVCEEETLRELQEIIVEIQVKYGLTPRQIFDASSNEIYIPLALFSQFGVLETAVKYLVENKGMRYAEIAKLLDRDPRVIWATYNNVKKKSIYIFKEVSGYMIPASIFSDRSRSLGTILRSYCSEILDMKI